MKRGILLRLIYGICLLAATSLHAAALWRHGLLWDYGGGIPAFTQVYWTALTFLDPLAAIMLFVIPRVGLAATLAIISSDVAHNLWFGGVYHVSFNWMIAAQCAFLIFVVVTLPSAWRSAPGGALNKSAGRATAHD